MYNTNDIKEQLELEEEKNTFIGTIKKVFVSYDTDGDRYVSSKPNGIYVTKALIEAERKRNHYLHISEEWALVSSSGLCLLLKDNVQFNIDKNIKDLEDKMIKAITTGLTQPELDLLRRRGLKI